MSTFLARMLIFGTVALIAACSSDQELDQVSGHIKVRMPWLKTDLALHPSDPQLATPKNKAAQLETSETKQNFMSLQFIRLSSVQNLKKVFGAYGEFLLYPQLHGSDVSGTTPEAQFFKLEKDRYIAMNSLSMQMAVLYAHAERLKIFDGKLGLAVNGNRRRMGIVDVEDRGEANNAFYHGLTDTLFFLPFNGQQNVATMFNSGVFAHEHFHSIFYKLVHQPLIAEKVLPQDMSPTLHGSQFLQHLRESNSTLSQFASATQDTSVLSTLAVKDQNYIKILIQGLNEGVADVWGWAYTGDPDFIAITLPSEKENRTLNLVVKTQDDYLRFPPKCVLRRFVEDMQTEDAALRVSYIRGKSYEFGTSFARLMKLYAETIQKDENLSSANARVKVAKLIADFLPQLRSYYTAELSQMVPIDLVKKFAQSQKLTMNQCSFFLRILNAPLNDGALKYSCVTGTDQQVQLTQTQEAKAEFCK